MSKTKWPVAIMLRRESQPLTEEQDEQESLGFSEGEAWEGCAGAHLKGMILVIFDNEIDGEEYISALITQCGDSLVRWADELGLPLENRTPAYAVGFLRGCFATECIQQTAEQDGAGGMWCSYKFLEEQGWLTITQ